MSLSVYYYVEYEAACAQFFNLLVWSTRPLGWAARGKSTKQSNGIVRRRMVCWPLKGLLSVYMCNVGQADSREYLSITEMAVGKVVGTLSNGRK